VVWRVDACDAGLARYFGPPDVERVMSLDVVTETRGSVADHGREQQVDRLLAAQSMHRARGWPTEAEQSCEAERQTRSMSGGPNVVKVRVVVKRWWSKQRGGRDVIDTPIEEVRPGAIGARITRTLTGFSRATRCAVCRPSPKSRATADLRTVRSHPACLRGGELASGEATQRRRDRQGFHAPFREEQRWPVLGPRTGAVG
jgi:hypothetical protein